MDDTETTPMNEPILTDARILRGTAKNIEEMAARVAWSDPGAADLLVQMADVVKAMTHPTLRLTLAARGVYVTADR